MLTKPKDSATPGGAAPDAAGAESAGDPTRPATMRAVTHDHYGPIENLTVRAAPRPNAGKGEVVVRVAAASLHVGDVFGVLGSPILMRVATGLFKPKVGIPGFDFAGTVVEVGPEVTEWQIGDRVFGASLGTCAEEVRAKTKHLARIPDSLTDEEAAALPTSGLAALHALRDVAKLEKGQRIVINGASGAVGHFALQLAHAWGAEVVAVCSNRNAEFVKELGADVVVDYQREDFTTREPRADVLFDNVENRPLAECRRAVRKKGLVILNSGTGAKGLRLIWRIFHPILLSPFISQRLRRYVSQPNRKDLEQLAELAASKTIRPAFDRVVPLEEAPAALEHLASGRARGKVVVRVQEPSD